MFSVRQQKAIRKTIEAKNISATEAVATTGTRVLRPGDDEERKSAMTASEVSDDRVLFDADYENRIATITLNNPKQRNSYNAEMRNSVSR
jgi:hypothetical protein